MSDADFTKREYRTDSDQFEAFLRNLDSDRQRAAEKYESLRRALVKFFQWNRSIRAEELADQSLSILEKKLASEKISNIPAYALGVARLVWREAFKRAQRDTALEEDVES